MNQTTTHNESPYRIPRLRFHMVARERNASNEKAPLTKAEREIKKILSQVNRDTVVGQQIIAGLSGDDTRFRILLSEFKDQVRGAEKHLRAVIGDRCVELLKRVS